MEGDRLCIRQITLLSKAVVSAISQRLLHSLFTEQFLPHRSELCAMKRWMVSKAHSAAPQLPACASQGCACTSDHSRHIHAPISLPSGTATLSPTWTSPLLLKRKGSHIPAALQAPAREMGTMLTSPGRGLGQAMDLCLVWDGWWGASPGIAGWIGFLVLGLLPGKSPKQQIHQHCGKVMGNQRPQGDPQWLPQTANSVVALGARTGRQTSSLKTSCPWEHFGRDELFSTVSSFQRQTVAPLASSEFQGLLDIKD